MSDDSDIQAYFNNQDINGNGYIDINDVVSYLELNGLSNAVDVARQKIASMDSDADGRVTYEEFKNYIQYG